MAKEQQGVGLGRVGVGLGRAGEEGEMLQCDGSDIRASCWGRHWKELAGKEEEGGG